MSKYIALLIEKDIGNGWPEGYFDSVVGAWKGEKPVRPPQGEYEKRVEFD